MSQSDDVDVPPGYHESQIREGEIVRESPITGETYRVTKWVDKGDDRIVALEKEKLRP